MKNIELLLNPCLVKKTPKKTYVIKNTIKNKQGSSIINGVAFTRIIKELDKVLCSAIRNESQIEFKFGKTFFKDKATYILLETVIYHLLKEYGFKVILDITPKIEGLYYGYIKQSLIYKYGNGKIIEKNRFTADYLQSYGINNFRKVVKKNKDPKTLSKLHSDIVFFLKHHIIDIDYIEYLSESISELVGNALEHGETDCLIDVHIDDVYKGNDKEQKYTSIDLVIVNFSNKLLGDGIKIKFEDNDFLNSPILKANLKKALANHEKEFCDWYTKDDFFNCASFQWGASGRDSSTDFTGGTGLPTFIENLINKSESVYCYVYSGNKVIYLKNGMVNVNNKFIGFNKENDFINHIPAKESIGRSQFWLKGTLYNLNFVKKKEGEDNEYDKIKI